MDKLSDEVRDRAARAVADTIRRGLSNNAVVDAVAEVLADPQSIADEARELKRKYEGLRKDNGWLESQVDLLHSARNDASDDADILIRENEQLKAQVARLQDRSDETRSAAARALVAENEQLKARVADGWQRRQDAWTRTANLARENRDLSANYTYVREQLHERTVETEQLRARVMELQDERDTSSPGRKLRKAWGESSSGTPGAVKWRKYQERMSELAKKHPDWRKGMVDYYAAFSVDPEWTATITNTARDPYHVDSHIPAFEAELRAGWNVPEGES